MTHPSGPISRFEHLSVLISIILGLGIAQLLTNVHGIVQARPRVQSYWLAWVWAGLIFVAQVEWWWSSFGFQDLPLEHWTFFYFLFILLSPVTLYLAAASARRRPGRIGGSPGVLLPSERLVLHHGRPRPGVDAVRRGLTSGNPMDVGVVTNVMAAVLVGSLGLTDRESYHGVLTLAITALFLYFILSAVLTLR